MDGAGDADGYCQGEIGEIKFTGLRTGKERAGGGGGPGYLFRPARGSVRLS